MLKIEKLNFAYKNKEIYINANLELYSGVYLLTGSNGSGKTTLFKLINKQINNESIITINGEQITKYDSIICSQDPVYIDYLTPIQNISLIHSNIALANEMLNMLNIDTSKQMKDLSGGQKQKVNFVCAMSSDYGIIMLDEPFNNLDNDSSNIVNDIIKCCDNKIIILSSHIKKVDYDSEIKIVNKKLEYSITSNKKLINNKVEIKNNTFLKTTYKKHILLLLILLCSIFIFTNLLSKIELYNSEHYFTSDEVVYSEFNENGNEINSLNVVPNTKFIETFSVKNKEDLSDDTKEYVRDQANLEVSQMLHPKEFLVTIDIPINSYNINYLIKGSYPENNSNEILIDETLAASYSLKVGDTYQNYTISGIYAPIDASKSVIYHSYNSEVTTPAYVCYENCTYSNGDVKNNNNIRLIIKDNKNSIFIMSIILITSIIFYYYIYILSKMILKQEIKFYETYHLKYSLNTIKLLATLSCIVVVLVFLTKFIVL